MMLMCFCLVYTLVYTEIIPDQLFVSTRKTVRCSVNTSSYCHKESQEFDKRRSAFKIGTTQRVGTQNAVSQKGLGGDWRNAKRAYAFVSRGPRLACPRACQFSDFDENKRLFAL